MAGKYEPGAVVETIEQLVAAGEAGDCFFWGNKPRPLNWAFLKNLQLFIILDAIRRGGFRLAVKKPQELEPFHLAVRRSRG